MDIVDNSSLHFGVNFNEMFSNCSFVKKELFYKEATDPILTEQRVIEMEEEHNGTTESCISLLSSFNPHNNSIISQNNQSKKDFNWNDPEENRKLTIKTITIDKPEIPSNHILISPRFNRDEIYLLIDQFLLQNPELFSKHFILYKNDMNDCKEECWIIQILKGMNYSKCILTLSYHITNHSYYINYEYLYGMEKDSSLLLFHRLIHILNDSDSSIIINNQDSLLLHNNSIKDLNFQFYNHPNNIKLLDELVISIKLSDYPDYQRNAIMNICDISQDKNILMLLYSKHVVHFLIDVLIQMVLLSNEDEVEEDAITSHVYRSPYELSELLMYILSTLSNFLILKEAFYYMKTSESFSNVLLQLSSINTSSSIVHDTEFEFIISSISERIRTNIMMFRSL